MDPIRSLGSYLWQIGGQDPRYKSFLQAQGYDMKYSPSSRTLYDSLTEEHRDRLQKYAYYWRLYLGGHWFSVSEENIDPLKINYCWVTVNKHAAFLMNKGFRMRSEFPEIEKFLDDNWILNNGGKYDNDFGANLAIEGGITGDAFVELMLSNSEITNQRYIKYKLCESVKSFPVLNRKNMEGFLYYGLEKFPVNENFGFAEYDTRYEGYYVSKGKKTIIVDDTPKKVIKYDIFDLPVIHFKNFPVPVDFYGLSDLINIYDLNLTFDRVITDVQDIIDYHAEPVTILKGAKIGELTRGPNKIWAIPKEAEISNLKLEGELDASVNHLKRIREHISELTNIPEGSVGKQLSISNTSASALAITFMPLYETMEYKRIVYGKSFLKLNASTIKLAILSGMLDVNQIIKNAEDRWKGEFTNYSDDIKNKYKPFANEINKEFDYNSIEAIYSNLIPPEIFQSSVLWFPPLPRDEASLSTQASTNISSNVWSRKYVRQNVYGMSERESLRMDKELDEEKTYSPENATVVTNSKVRGNPDVVSEEESKRIQSKSDNI